MKTRIYFRYLLLTLLVSFVYFSSIAATTFVNANVVGGTNDGTSWTNAYTDLQTALSNAVAGDEIWVAAATYKPTATTNRDISFEMKNGVAIYGGFNGTEDLRSKRDFTNNVTILSGDIGAAGNSDNTYHVISNFQVDNTAILDGFTIRDGNANGGGGVRFIGGGMFNGQSSPIITNCIFTENSANSGGAIRNNSSSPTISYCTFINNTAAVQDGGAIYNNTSSPNISHCFFSGNNAVSDAGSIFNTGSSPTISNCIFTGETAASRAGSILSQSNASGRSNTTVENCQFIGNQAATGGAVYTFSSDASFTNCIFIGNAANSNGGAVYHTTNATIDFTNCSFSGNSSPSGGTFFNNTTLNIANCIIWGNDSDILDDASINYSIVEGGFAGVGNLDANPNFVDQPAIGLGTSGDLRLADPSPAYNTGNDADVPVGITTDLDGNLRIALGQVDMGAYESIVPLLDDVPDISTLEVNICTSPYTASFDPVPNAIGYLVEVIIIARSNEIITRRIEEANIEGNFFLPPRLLGTTVSVRIAAIFEEDGEETIGDYSDSRDFVLGCDEDMIAVEERNLDIEHNPLKAYPNPIKDGVLNLRIPNVENQTIQVQLFNNLGQLVYIQQFSGYESVQINLPDLETGIYTLVLEAGEKHWNERVVIE